MKKGIHPKYYSVAKIVCACGNVITAGSTVPEMKVEICSACHPFYTGKKKMLDATGRVDRFKKMAEKAAAKKLARQSLGESGEAAKQTKAEKPARPEKVKIGEKDTKPEKTKKEIKK